MQNRYLILRRIFVLPIKIYQLVISPLMPPACRYVPTCSAYAAQAILRFGIIAGSWLALKRIIRCNPWGGCGHDPVPDKFSFKWNRRSRYLGK